MFKRVFFVTLYFLSPGIPILVSYNTNTAKYGDLYYLTALILGSAAFTWLLWEFVLSSRPKFIEKFFGMDKFYRFHGLMAVISVTLVFLHRTIRKEIGGDRIARELGEKAWILFLIAIIIALIFMVDSILLKFKPLEIFRKLLKKIQIIKYEFYVFIHNLTVIAAIIMFLHVMSNENSRMYLSVRMVYTIYFTLGISFYIYHRVIKPIILNHRSFVVREVVKESPNIRTIIFAPKKGGIFQYKPGQFGFFRILGKNVMPVEHPFTISSNPLDKDSLSVTIKELGDFTSKIMNIKPGYRAFIDAPYGKFSYINFPEEEGVVFIAGGIGITPYLSMLRYLRSTDPERNVVLLWGINTQKDLICEKEFKEMQMEMKSFLFIPVMFKDDTWEGEKGIINKNKIEEILGKHGHTIHSKGYYVCGPRIMMEGVIKSLKELGVKRNRIHYEKFSL